MIIDKHEVRLYSGAVQLEPLDDAGTITADRGWSPHVQGRVTVRTPSNLDHTAPDSTLTLELTQRFGDFALTRDLTDAYAGDLTSDLTTAFGGRETSDLTAIITAGSWTTPVRAATGRTLRLVVNQRSRTRDTHTLELASSEVTSQDWLWYDVDSEKEGLPITITANTPAEFLHEIIAAHEAESGIPDYYTLPTIVDLSTPVTMDPNEFTIATGSGTFAALREVLTRYRKRLYSPGDGTMLLVDYPYTVDGTLTVEDGLNLIDWEINEDRPVNGLVRYTGSDTDPDARPVYSSRQFPSTQWPHEVIYDAPHPSIYIPPDLIILPEVDQLRTDPYLTSIGLDLSPVRLVTINDYSVMPGSSVAYTLPDEDEETDTIDAITWQLGGDHHMDVWI